MKGCWREVTGKDLKEETEELSDVFLLYLKMYFNNGCYISKKVNKQ